MIHLMGSCKDGTSHGKIDRLINVISLGQEDGTLLGSSVRA